MKSTSRIPFLITAALAAFTSPVLIPASPVRANSPIPFGGNLGGSLSGVDYNDRSFDVRARNGSVYHVDGSSAVVERGGRRVPFRNIPNNGSVRVYFGRFDRNTLTIVANRIVVLNSGGSIGGFPFPIPNIPGTSYPGVPSGSFPTRRLGGEVVGIDYNAHVFDMRDRSGRVVRINARRATVFNRGRRVSFDQLQETQTVTVVVRETGELELPADAIYLNGFAGGGPYNDGDYAPQDNGRWNQRGRGPGWRGRGNPGRGHAWGHYKQKKHDRDDQDEDEGDGDNRGGNDD